MKTCLTLAFVFVYFLSFSQNVVSGKVTDEKGGPIPGANVYLEGTYDGGSTDENGYFSFTTKETGTKTLIVSFLSFETYAKEIEVNQFLNQIIKLKESVNVLDAVILTAGTFEAGDKARVSVLKPLDIVTTAGAVGDIIGALATLPGAQTVGESNRLFVRGGEADETQTFVDGLRVAQPYGATANDLPDHVPEEIKQDRYERFMEVQQAITAAKLQKRIGQTMTVLVDDLDEEFPVAIARSYADAPEIDGNVFVEDIDKSLIKSGDLLEVEITDADEYDLYAKLIQIKSA